MLVYFPHLFAFRIVGVMAILHNLIIHLYVTCVYRPRSAEFIG